MLLHFVNEELYKTSNPKMCLSLSLFQHKESPAPREGLPLGRAASHARQTEERQRRDQTRPDQRRFQEEPRRLHAVRPRELTRRSD